MDVSTLRRMLRSLGLTVKRDGTITMGDWTFGVMDTDCILLKHTQKPEGGIVVVIEEVESIGYCDSEHMLSIEYTDGRSTTVTGDYPLMGPVKPTVERKMPKALSKLNDVYDELYPDVDDQVYYDELRERNMVDLGMFGREQGYEPITDSIMAIYNDHIERRLDECGFKGNTYPSKDIRLDALMMHAWDHKRNLFREWVESHEWDGQPRVRRWLIETMGACAPPLASIGKETEYLENVTEAWILGAIARNFSRTPVVHDIVPVFLAVQGYGKGRALEYTAGKSEWYIEATGDIDKEKDFLEGISGRVIVELSESRVIRDGNIEKVKGFISKPEDQYRKSYAHFEGQYPRHFIFAASSNLSNVFTDITGARRFFPMYCDATRQTRDFSTDGTVGAYDVEQMWAEALQMYRDGHLCYLDDETKDLAGFMQDFTSVENSNVDIIDDWLDDPANGYHKIGAKISKSTIMTELFDITPRAPIPREMTTAYNAWANGTKQWVKMAQTARIGGKVRRGYERIAEPGQIRRAQRLRISNGGVVKDGKAKAESSDPCEYFRKYAQAHDLGEDSVIDRDDLPPQVFDYLWTEGYVYESSYKNGKSTYVIGVLP